MIKPEEMSKLKIVAPKAYMSQVVNSLYGLRLYHILSHERGKGEKQKGNLDIGSPLQEAEMLSNTLIKTRGIIARLGVTNSITLKIAEELTKKHFEKIKKQIDALYDKVNDVTEELKQNSTEMNILVEKKKIIDSLLKFKVDMTALKKSKSLSFFIGNVNSTEKLEELLKTRMRSYSLKIKDDMILLVVANEAQKTASSILPVVQFTALNLEKVDFLQKLEKQKSAVDKAISKVRAKKGELTKFVNRSRIEYKRFLLKTEFILSEEVKKAELPLRFAVTSKSFIAEGWVPMSKKRKITSVLEAVSKKKIYLKFEDPKPKEKVPTKMAHSKMVGPFEFLLRLYDLPSYKEIDPTWLIFLTFPLFFGFMLGDVVYGLILAVFFISLKKMVKSKPIKQLASILLFAAIVTMLFGFVFGEYLGFEHVSVQTGEWMCDNLHLCLHEHTIMHHGESMVVYDFPRLLTRMSTSVNVMGFEMLSVLVIGFIVGFIHLNLGLLIGFYNEYIKHGFWAAFFEKISWMVLQLGVIIMALTANGTLIPSMMYVGIFIFLVSVIMLFKGEGIKGIIELPSIFTNLLSYMRLGAVGLASVGLAMVVNEKLAMPFIHKGGWFILIGAIILIFGHGINLLLGLIGPFLHGIRLHYVEFFTKFYRGGGVEFKPFGLTKK